MKRYLLRLFALSVFLCCAESVCVAAPQDDTKSSQPPANTTEEGKPAEAPPETATAKSEFFAGTLTTVDAEHIIVSRRLVGKAPESRTFLMQSKTKTNRALKPKQRVTVRYQHLPEGDIALEVLVRQPRTTKPS